MELMDDLLEAADVARGLRGHLGKTYGLTLGVVCDRNDQGQIKAITPKAKTDWLIPIRPQDACSMPVPPLGATVAILYQDGDGHKGFWLGVLGNALNPHKGNLGDHYQVTPGVHRLTVNDTLEIQVGPVTLRVSGGNLDISGVTGVSIEGAQVATVGARDSANHPLVNRGW
jgi:hypothetical protein